MNPKLLMVDDDVELCLLMQEFFASHGIAVDLCHDGAQGIAQAAAYPYALVLLDVMMPQMDGFAVLEQLRRHSQVPVLMLTARTESASRIRGLESGADDYLPKPFEPMELLARVRAILRRAAPPKPQEAGLRIDLPSRTVTVDGAVFDLTSAEFDVLDVLHRGVGRVVSRDEIAQRLYQRDSTPFDRAIDVHVSHIRKKLEGTRVRILTIRGVGYQLSGPEGGV